MAGRTVDFEMLINPDNLGVEIGSRWKLWDSLRNTKKEDWKELSKYIFATDTSTTANAVLPWSNTTTMPKLTQIRDNLHANYMSTLFPSSDWLLWVANNSDSNRSDKKTVIKSYMKTKLMDSGFEETMSNLVLDWIDYGNCFGEVQWVDDYKVNELGEVITTYVGPKLVRISPYDIVFNPIANSFKETPKIVRTIYTLGELKRMVDKDPSVSYYSEVFDKVLAGRAAVRGGGAEASYEKSDGFVADGFSSIQMYYESDYVEVLTFYGDIYDTNANELMLDRVITVVDRAYVLDNSDNPSWLGSAPIYHAGWRKRPDNLWAMGPLDNLVGMQYRLDHLENMKADVFDQIAYPTVKIKGDVEDFEFGPGARIICGEEGDVQYLFPDATALNADLQMDRLENKMEEMAGAPRQAMGIRTPGEKTAFEVQELGNSSSRIFQHKASSFEMTFEEPVLNGMLELSRRKMNTVDTIRVVDSASGVTTFSSITKEDIVGSGRITPVGARHFAERARRVQSLAQLGQLKQDPTIGVHISGKEMARILTEEIGEPKLFGDNIQIQEQLETQQQQQNAEVENQETLATSADFGI
jgi:hypothetical protein